ncbi:MAG: hypothetical protein R3183_13885 [Oleiphilaceae bacterium]|nr:hypothetical protein [Oleiphilaceae bacterium]
MVNRTFGNRFFIVAVCAVLLLSLIALLLDRMETPMAQAERTHVAVRLAELKSAVLLMQATMVAADDWSRAEQYVGSNPMEWLELDEDQRHYLGEMPLEQASDQRGKWVFDPKRRVIAYRPLSDAWWPDAVAPSLPWLQFRVVGLWSDDSPRRIRGLDLVSLDSKGQVLAGSRDAMPKNVVDGSGSGAGSWSSQQ